MMETLKPAIGMSVAVAALRGSSLLKDGVVDSCRGCLSGDAFALE